jgi:HD-like signal output (HDOD) protein/DNA-binding CsgD family transcriptional regulator
MSSVTTAARVGVGSAVRPMGAGGQRLAAAFDAISRLPALAEAQDRILFLSEQPTTSSGELAEAVEADAALAIAVMHAANNGDGPSGRTGSVPKAVESLTSEGVAAIAERMETYDMLGAAGSGSDGHERFRRHAMAVRAAADRVGELGRIPERDELAVAALLHDVGRLVLGELYGREFGLGLAADEEPEDRLRRERRELGIDHALVGGVLLRRWGLPAPLATAVERHHAEDAEGLAAAVGLADLVAHQAGGGKVSGDALRAAGARVGIDEDGLRGLLFEYPHSALQRPRAAEPCPLSTREVDALRGLAEGKVYKQIAQELSLSVSTVRTHLHNVYKKIGAVDRAQAVLLARDRGWI